MISALCCATDLLHDLHQVSLLGIFPHVAGHRLAGHCGVTAPWPQWHKSLLPATAGKHSVEWKEAPTFGRKTTVFSAGR